MIIQHNIPSLNAHRNYGVNANMVSKNLEKLSSGYRINRAGDDAAGLAISEKMRGQIRGLGMAERNCGDAISLIQTGEGALNEIHAILHRGRELLVQATNGTYQVEDREQIQLELAAINKEVDRIAVSTKFNGVRIFSGKSSAFDFENVDLGTLGNDAYMRLVPESNRNTFLGEEIYIQPPKDLNRAEIGLTVNQMIAQMGNGFNITGTTQEDIVQYMQDYWLPNAMQQLQDTFQSFQGANHNIYVDFTNTIPGISGVNDNPGAVCLYSGGGGADGASITKISIVIDLDDAFELDGTVRNNLGNTIAHELMHAFMAEIAPDYALNRSGDRRAWFNEGMASLINGGLANTLSKHTQGPTVTMDLANTTDPYQDGYLACAYAAFLASGSNEISATSISYGMDLILAKLRETGSLSDALEATIGIDLDTFEAQMAGGNAGVTGARMDLDTFYDGLITTSTGPSGPGAGSVLSGNLSTWSNYLISNRQGDYTSTKGFVFHFSNDTAEEIYIQAGSNGENVLWMQFDNVDSGSLGIGNVYAAFESSMRISQFIEKYDTAITKVSSVRAELGALQNRLEHTLNNLGVTKENLTAAESTIRDADMAKEMMEFTKNNILVQAAQSMLAQANSLPQGVLSLLR